MVPRHGSLQNQTLRYRRWEKAGLELDELHRGRTGLYRAVDQEQEGAERRGLVRRLKFPNKPAPYSRQGGS